jgi:type II secretory pathway component GspD/PulD (secretin)
VRNITGVTVMLWVMGLGAFAQEPSTNAPVVKPHLITEYGLPGLEKKISLDLLEAMDVVDLIKFLCTKANLNVIIGRDVSGSSKLMLKDVTLGDALEIVLAANDLAYEVKGNIVKIMTDKTYRDLYGEGFYERKQAKVIQLKYAMPSKVAQLLDSIKSGIGKIVFDDGTGNIVLIDTPPKIREMEAIIERSELPTIQRILPTETTNFVLQYAKIEDIEPQLTPLLTKDVGQIRSDKRTKTLIVTDLAPSMPKICELVAIFDRPQKQVFIEAKIVQVQLTDSLSLGVDWDHLFQGLNPRFDLKTASKSSGNLGLDIAESAASGVGGSISYHTIAAGGDLNLVVQALAKVGKTRLLQNPHIATLDGQEATIKAVRTEPYAETTMESGTTNITGKTYKFVDVGVTLAVTPRINELGFITCEIRPEVSSVLRWYDSDASSSSGNSGVPVVQKSYAETSVSVKDGVTIIIAGMIDEVEKKDRTQIPLLGSIPFLGALFRSDSKSTENTETIVLLTPRIVTGAKFFERAKDMKKPTKSDVVVEAGLLGSDMTP